MRRHLAFLLILSSTPAARAGCGLDLCGGSSVEASWALDASVRSARFRWAGFSGRYSQAQGRLLSLWPRWSAGAVLSLVALDEGGRRAVGMGSPVLFAERRSPGGAGFSAGLQAELPGGNHRMGVASEHGELLPYAAWDRSAPIPWSVRLGLRTSLNDGHSHGPAAGGRPLLVGPHDDKEFLYRLGLSGREGAAVQGELFLDGVHAFSADAAGPAFLSAGVSASIPAGVRVAFEQSLSRPRRFESRAGLSFLTRW